MVFQYLNCTFETGHLAVVGIGMGLNLGAYLSMRHDWTERPVGASSRRWHEQMGKAD